MVQLLVGHQNRDRVTRVGLKCKKTTLLGLGAAWEMLSVVFFECFKHA